jgi:MFS family permease
VPRQRRRLQRWLRWGLSNFELGLVGTVRTMMAALSAPLWGFAADRLSRKLVLFIGTGVWGIWTLICGLVPSFGTLLVVRTISGIGLGCLLPATFPLLSDTFAPHRRGRRWASWAGWAHWESLPVGWRGTRAPSLRGRWHGLCLLFFAGFYWSYPRDAARLRALMARRRTELATPMVPAPFP